MPSLHANLNWTFGPFRYVLASPVFHRWHHVREPAIHDKNFAPTFPIFDLMFGTFHMPKAGERCRPAMASRGRAGQAIIGQMIHPFAAIRRTPRLRRKRGARGGVRAPAA